MKGINNGKCVVLGHYLVGTYFKFISVIPGPPVAQCAITIKLAAFVIKTMCHFVTYNCTDTSVIYGIIGPKIKEWELQYSGRKSNGIICRTVRSVNGWW